MSGSSDTFSNFVKNPLITLNAWKEFFLIKGVNIQS